MLFHSAIFDLDGTLIESNSVWEKINRKMLQKRGIRFSEELPGKLASMTYDEVIEAMHLAGVKDSGEEIINELNTLAIYEYRNNIFLKDNVKEYLDYLKSKSINIALATASPDFLYEPVLRNNNIYKYFDAFCTTDEVGKSKDFPDIYLCAAAKLDTASHDCIVFEDLLKGIVSAKNIGMKTVGVYDFYSNDDIVTMRLIADKYIINFSEMFNI